MTNGPKPSTRVTRRRWGRCTARMHMRCRTATDMMKGRSAIEALWRQQMQQIGDVKCTALDVKPLGRSAAREIGTCSFKTKAQPPQDGALKYAVVWEKAGSQWRLLQD